jgi:hypothetical protein
MNQPYCSNNIIIYYDVMQRTVCLYLVGKMISFGLLRTYSMYCIFVLVFEEILDSRMSEKKVRHKP